MFSSEYTNEFMEQAWNFTKNVVWLRIKGIFVCGYRLAKDSFIMCGGNVYLQPEDFLEMRSARLQAILRFTSIISLPLHIMAGIVGSLSFIVFEIITPCLKCALSCANGLLIESVVFTNSPSYDEPEDAYSTDDDVENYIDDSGDKLNTDSVAPSYPNISNISRIPSVDSAKKQKSSQAEPKDLIDIAKNSLSVKGAIKRKSRSRSLSASSVESV